MPNGCPSPATPASTTTSSIFVAEQELLRQLAAESSLPVLELDVSDDDVGAACGRIADWLASTGGLWAVDPSAS